MFSIRKCNESYIIKDDRKELMLQMLWIFYGKDFG